MFSISIFKHNLKSFFNSFAINLSFILAAGLILNCSTPEVDKNKANQKNQLEFKNTLGTVDPMGNLLEADGSNGIYPFRLFPGTTIKTTAKAKIKLDNGSLILLDKDSNLVVDKNRIEFKQGRVWFDLNQNKLNHIVLPVGKLSSRNGDFDIEQRKGRFILHHIKGELNFHSGVVKQLDGGSFELSKEGAKLLPKELWIDWTGGFSRKASDKFGYGVLYGYGSGTFGDNYKSMSEMILRKHKVEVRIRKNLAITEVEQVFFNSSSKQRDGEYRVKLPPGAVLADVAIATGSSYVDGVVTPVYRGESFQHKRSNFYFMGRRLYGANIVNIAPSREVSIRFSYYQTLPVIRDRRFYKYSMAGGIQAGDFELGIRITDDSAEFRTGWDGKWEKKKYVIRKTDFKPTSDFVVEIFPSHKIEANIEVSKDKKNPFMLSIPLKSLAQKLIKGKLPKQNNKNVVFLLDLSGSISSDKIHLIKTGFSSILEKFNTNDQVAALVLRNEVTPLDKAGLKPLDASRKKTIMENLSRKIPGGATDLGRAIEKASVLIPQGDGTIIYIGDGQPSRGAMISEKLKFHLSLSSPPPTFYSILVGDNSRSDMLEVLGTVYQGDSLSEITSIVSDIIKESANSIFKDVKIEGDNNIARITPAHSLPMGLNSTFYAYGFMEDKVPEEITLKGYFNGDNFARKIKLKKYKTSDPEALKKLWANSRLKDLVVKGAGYEAIRDLAARYDLVSSFTGLVFVFSGYKPDVINIPKTVWENIPDLGAYRSKMLQDRPPNKISGLSIPDLDSENKNLNLEHYYQNLLASGSRKEAVNECYNKKAMFSPQEGGKVVYRFKIGQNGKLVEFKNLVSTLKDDEIIKCINRVLEVMPDFPSLPSGKELVFNHTWKFKSTGQILPRKCSKLSKAYLKKRKRVWRQRIGFSPSSYKSEKVWRQAQSQCELSEWVYKKALLDIILKRIKSINNKLRFAVLMKTEGHSVYHYLKEKIIRSISTVNEAELVARTFEMGGGALYAQVKKEINKLLKEKGKQLDSKEQAVEILKIIKRFYKLDKDNSALSLLYAGYALVAQRKNLAQKIARRLLKKTVLTSGQRRKLAYLLARTGNKELSRLVMSNGVEMAPYDPLARKKLGDFFFKGGHLSQALSEYKILGWFLPQHLSPRLLVAKTRIARGQTELGLRVLERLSLKDGSKIITYLLEFYLAQLLEEARKNKSNSERRFIVG
ncbi:MAG: AgmX/PglI C-terminal domain-containing protein [Myxococcota bacterium]